jgi:pimeloyl-ACP methyl ester carboxylesterase
MAISTAYDEEAVRAGRTLDVAGIRTHLHDHGDGPPVLLLHGSGPGVSAWSNWRPVYPGLGERFRLIAPDQLGFNETAPPPDGRYGRRAWTDHAIALLDELGIERCSIVGNSMGGAVALSVAAAAPERVDRIVVMGTMGVEHDLPAGLDTAWGYEPSPEAMRELISLFAYDQSIVTDELIDLRYRASVEGDLQPQFAAMFPQPRQRWVDDLALSNEELAALPQPILLVHGYDDRIIPFAATSLKLMDLLSDRRLHVFGRCGHWVMIEQTRPFVDVVGAFLSESTRS